MRSVSLVLSYILKNLGKSEIPSHFLAMPLKDTFAAIRPRETAGSRSADRFDYQRDWALCRLLQIHESGQSYLMVFDYHDDVLVLDSDEDPTKVAFFQVKTKSPSSWTISELTRAKRGATGPGLSYMAKLYGNKVSFPDHTERLTFVSNAHVNCTLRNGSSAADQEEISFEEISETECDKLSAAVKQQCALSGDPDLSGLLVFNAAAISLKDHAGHAKGKVTEFLERLLPGKKIRPGAVYSGLAGEIVRRNHCTENCSSLQEVAEKKGLSRKAVESLLQEMQVYETEVALWPLIESRLNSEQCPFSRVAALRKRWSVVFAKHTDPTNTLLRDAFREVRRILDESQPPARLIDWLDELVTKVPRISQWRTIFDDDDIRVIALITLYDDTQPKTPKLPPSNQGTTDPAA